MTFVAGTGILPGALALIQNRGNVGPESASGLANATPSYSAEHLARVFGTEEDPVNCSFYFKIGVCRAGDKCSKKHNFPIISQTLLLLNMYPVPQEGISIGNGEFWTDDMYNRVQKHVEDFYEDAFVTLAEYGEIDEVVVVENTMPYMLGNVYVKYRREEEAEKALKALTGRYYMGRMIRPEYAPVTDFREARCRAHHETRCHRLGACRFLHFKHIPKAVKRRVARLASEKYREQRKREREAGEKGQGKHGEKGQDKGGEQMALAGEPKSKRTTPGPYVALTEGSTDVYDPEEMPDKEHPQKNVKDGAASATQEGQAVADENEVPRLDPRRRRIREAAAAFPMMQKVLKTSMSRRDVMEPTLQDEEPEYDPEAEVDERELDPRRRQAEVDERELDPRRTQAGVDERELDPRRTQAGVDDSEVEMNNDQQANHEADERDLLQEAPVGEGELEYRGRPRRRRAREVEREIYDDQQEYHEARPRRRRHSGEIEVDESDQLQEAPVDEWEEYRDRPRRRRARETEPEMYDDQQEYEEDRPRRRRHSREIEVDDSDQLQEVPIGERQEYRDRPRRRRAREIEPEIYDDQQEYEEDRPRRRRHSGELKVDESVLLQEAPIDDGEQYRDRPRRRRAREMEPETYDDQQEYEEDRPRRRRRTREMEPEMYDDQQEYEEDRPRRRRRAREMEPEMYDDQQEYEEDRPRRRRRAREMEPEMYDDVQEYDEDCPRRRRARAREPEIADDQQESDEARPRRRRRSGEIEVDESDQLQDAPVDEWELECRDRPRRRRTREMEPEIYDDQQEYDEDRPRRHRYPGEVKGDWELECRDRPRRRRAREVEPEMYEDQQEYDDDRPRRRRHRGNVEVDEGDL